MGGSRLIVGTLASVIAAGCGGSSDFNAVASSDVTVTDEAVATRRAVLLESRDDSGVVATTADGSAGDVLRAPGDHAFFRSFGTNDRACVHCHVPAAGWTITPETVQLRFTNPLDAADPACLADPFRCRAERNPRDWGRDPLFRPVDGAVSPSADVSTTAARLAAYRLLLEKALIRVGMPIPADAEFTLVAVDDPYKHASAAELSLFRRPLPATNLGTGDGSGTQTLSAVMWDGRETDLAHQANDATRGHAQALHDLTVAEQQEIVDFETHLHTAQLRDRSAGDLSGRGANGGPRALAAQTYYPGINDSLGGDGRTGAPFDRDVFDLYRAWSDSRDRDQARVARGEALFNRRTFVIRGVGGLNDALGKTEIVGSCTTCHDSPNYGHHSRPLALDLGISDGARRTRDLPLYTLRNKRTGETVQTTDPGRALVTGRWSDIGKFKGPILRGVAARAPYFHNGSAASLHDVVRFYDQRFAIGLSDDEQRDLVAFLRTL
jgi:RoxA-like, cytochrome c-like